MITTGMINGHKAIWLENGLIRLAVLPDKGADIPLLYHQPSGVQFMMQTPLGLQPPSAKSPMEFLDNYEGGCQELFPNCGDTCQVRGVSLPMHGEVAGLPWEYEVIGDDEIHLWVDCRQTPFHLDRWMRIHDNTLEMEGRVTNLGSQEWPFVWGQHLVLGGDFLEEGCQIEIPATHILTPTMQLEPATSRLADGQWSAWPHAIGRLPGQAIDLQHIPGPQIHSHDDAFLTGFQEGRLKVTNPRLGLGVHVTWDAKTFPWLTMWMPYGGPEKPPLTDIYGLGIEPWVFTDTLEKALAEGKALHLGAGQVFETRWTIRIEAN